MTTYSINQCNEQIAKHKRLIAIKEKSRKYAGRLPGYDGLYDSIELHQRNLERWQVRLWEARVYQEFLMQWAELEQVQRLHQKMTLWNIWEAQDDDHYSEREAARYRGVY